MYIVHYFLQFTGLYLRSPLSQAQLDHMWKKIAYELVTMKGNKGDLSGFLCEEIVD